MKTAERLRARELRRVEGRSVREIAAMLGVSRGTVSVWVRDIPLSAEQQAVLARRNPIYNGQCAGAAANARKHRVRREACQQHGRELARRDPAFAAGCMLYWAEGDKSRNVVALSNSDPDLLVFFMEFLRRYFDVQDEKVRIHCNLFADHLERQKEIEGFWLARLKLPPSSLGRSAVNVYSKYSQKKRKNRLPYGTCKVAVCDTAILQAIYGGIQEYGGFDRPEWLD